MGDYYKLTPEEPQRAYFEISRLIFTGFAAAMVTVISLMLITIYCFGGKTSLCPRNYTIFILLLVVLIGTIIRLLMASVYYGNFDMQAYERVAAIAMRGDNVYALTGQYNYSPIWFMILSFLKYVQMHLPAVSYHFIIRSFLCMVDLTTLVFLLLIASHKAISLPKVAMLFYLNPVSFLITGYHGQFENLAVLMIVIGLFAYLKLNQKPVWGIALLWFFAAAGMIIKHNVFYELIICLNRAIKRYWVKFLLFAGAVCLFLALFIPYWDTGKEGIIRNVFMYSSGVGGYGIVSLLNFPQFKYLFIIGMFIFPLFLGNRDIIRQCLLGFLFFMTFTSGMSIQYFVLPIAIGALFPSKGFLLYCLTVTECLLINRNNICLPGLHLSLNIIWFSAIYWFVSELIQSRKAVAITVPEGLTRGKNIRNK